MKCAATLALVCIVSCGSALSQSATGLPPFGTFDGGTFDAVNVANLNVHFSVPVFSKPGVGLSFNYAQSYDGTVWQPITAGGVTSWTPVVNWGWRAPTQEALAGILHYKSQVLP